MTTTNGRADIVGPPITLGDFLPERREVIVNGETYLAWVTTNRRYPRKIMGRLDKAARVYNNAISALLDNNAPQELRLQAAENQPEAWQQYVTDAVMLLIPDLIESEIDLIETDALENLLRELGYFNAKDTEVDKPEGEAETGESVPLTGDISLPDSVDSTPGIPTTNS